MEEAFVWGKVPDHGHIECHARLFSDGGHHNELEKAMEVAGQMLVDGATIIDVGGESTRPGAAAINSETEIERVVPVIETLVKKYDCIISIDTYRAATAQAAVKAGAHIVNDVWGCNESLKSLILPKQPAQDWSSCIPAGIDPFSPMSSTISSRS